MPPSGTVAARSKKTYLTAPLTDEMAKNIGIEEYYAPCRRAFKSILVMLDREVRNKNVICVFIVLQQIGRPFMRTSTTPQKEIDEMLSSAERKPKVDLLHVCVVSIPRLLPDGMQTMDLIDMLCRLTVHYNADVAAAALQVDLKCEKGKKKFL